MKNFFIGLGNPGKKYLSTRHNAGRMLAGWLKAEGSRISEKFEIVETDCFMNRSGEWLHKFYKNYKGYKSYENLFIAHDDLDLPLGSFKIQFGRGPRLHKGILSIEKALGTKDFWRVRIGVEGRRKKEEGRRISGEEYVLRPFRREEKIILKQTFKSIKLALSAFAEDPVTSAGRGASLEYCTKNTRSRVFSA